MKKIGSEEHASLLGRSISIDKKLGHWFAFNNMVPVTLDGTNEALNVLIFRAFYCSSGNLSHRSRGGTQWSQMWLEGETI